MARLRIAHLGDKATSARAGAVFVADDDITERRAQFATHRSLGGFASDHRPLLARIRLY